MAFVGIGKGINESKLCFDCDILIPKGTLEQYVYECTKPECGEVLCDNCANQCSDCRHYFCLKHSTNEGKCKDCANIKE